VAGFDDFYDAALTRSRIQEISDEDADLLDGQEKGRAAAAAGFRILGPCLWWRKAG
jgi:hypothetical protein